MGTLNPTPNFDTDFEKPVATPSLVGGLANLGSALISSIPEKQGPSQADIKFQRNQQLQTKLVGDLNKAQAVREQGDPRKADLLERQAKVDFTLGGGDLSAGETQELIFTVTGVEAEDVGFSPEELVRQDILNSPEYMKNFAAVKFSNPELSQEDLQTRAIIATQQEFVNSQVVMQTKVNCNSKDGQTSRLNLIDLWSNANRGVLTMIGERGQPVTLEDVQAARVDFGTLQSEINLSRPAGLEAGEWAPVEKALLSVQNQLDTAERLLSSGNYEAIALQEIMFGLDKLEEKGEISEFEKNVFFLELKRNPALIQTFSFKDISSVVSSLNDLDPAEAAETVDAGTETLPQPKVNPTKYFSDPEVKRARRENAQELLIEARDQFKLTNTMNFSDSVDAWTRATHQGLASMYAMAARHEGWLGKESYASVFNSRFFMNLNTAKAADERVFISTFNKTNEALDAHRTAIRAGLRSRTAGDIVGYDSAANALVFNKDVFMESEAVGSAEKSAFMSLVETKYGGDFMSAVLDKGTNFSFARVVQGELEDGDVLNRIEALKQIDLIKTRMSLMAEDFNTVEGGDGQAEVGGGQADDALSANGPIAQSLGIDFGAYEQQYGLPTGYLERMAMIESSGNPNARAKSSTAEGLFQFIDSTAAQYGLTNKFDPVASTDAAARLAVDNANSLRRALGREPQAWELYLAHQQGAGGAARLLANPSGKAVDAVGKAAVVNNGGHEGMTSGEFMRIWSNKWTQTSGRGPTSRQEATGLASPASSLRPQVAPDDLPAVGIDNVRPQARPQSGGEDLSGQVTLAQATTPAEGEKRPATPDTEPLKIQTEKLLKRLGIDPEDVPNFTSEEDVRRAIQNGDIGPDDVIILNGQIIVL